MLLAEFQLEVELVELLAGRQVVELFSLVNLSLKNFHLLSQMIFLLMNQDQNLLILMYK